MHLFLRLCAFLGFVSWAGLCACDESTPEELNRPAPSADASVAFRADAAPIVDVPTYVPDAGGDLMDAGPVIHPDASPPDMGVNCDDRKIVSPSWPSAPQEVSWAGHIEFGQTHVSTAADTRHTPALIEHRAALLLFTPDLSLPAGHSVFVRVVDGSTASGSIQMRGPDQPPEIFEQGLTPVTLDAYSSTAYSANLPWNWIRENVVLQIAYLSEDSSQIALHEHRFESLSAPHRFTVTRAKMVLFGELDFPTATKDSGRILRDFYGSVPASTMRWVDYLPWRLDSIVITTTQGPQLINSEAEHDHYTNDDHHWSIIKNQFALRLSLANTGRGLSKTRMSEGDNSPYSFGTSVAMGWFRRPDGVYQDLDDAPWAAGWTGWTAMWHNECGNGFIHELGHSFTLAHFTSGTASRWGIGAEYPQDGTNLSTHPWGYDNVSNKLRTWYRVDNSGPVLSNGNWVGKRDPMNGGESPNGLTCFPQYTGYHAWKAQRWMVDGPTIMNGPAGPGVYRFNPMMHQYVQEAPPDIAQDPIAIDTQVVTIIGTLGRNSEAMQTYPPLHAPSGNVFELPDPFSPNLPSHFSDARYFLEINYANRATDYALIARPEVTDDQLYLYALNIRADTQPTEVKLHRADAAYPNIQQGQSTVLHTRSISAPSPLEFAPVLTIGRGRLANQNGFKLEQTCEWGVNCDTRGRRSSWRRQNDSLAAKDLSVSFEEQDEINILPRLCSEFDQPTTFSIPVESDTGMQNDLRVQALRIVSGAGQKRTVAMDDETDWIQSPDLEQALSVWVPHSSTASLAAGHYRTTQPYWVGVHYRDEMGNSRLEKFPVRVEIEVFETQIADLSSAEYVSAPMMTNNSSMYFLPRDPGVGPTSRVWWNDGDPNPPLLSVPVRADSDGHQTHLFVRAQHQSCGSDRRDLHAGEASRNCAHSVVLFVDSSDNTQLTAGETYRSNESMPLVIDGRRWHEPNNHDLVGTVALQLIFRP
jgi:hypothetical protein